MSYIKDHWQGRQSLARSFWINFFLLSLLVQFAFVYLAASPPDISPVLIGRAVIISLALYIGLVYPWQLVGVWRSADKRFQQTGKNGLTALVKILVLLSVISSFGSIGKYKDDFADALKYNFGYAKVDDYTVDVTGNGTLARVTGGIGFGLPGKIEDTIEDTPQIDGIILDSSGGRVYEGRKLARVIDKYNLDTYSLRGCYSACTVAYIAGEKRYLSNTAEMGFHGYSSLTGDDSTLFKNPRRAEKKDMSLLKENGVPRQFVQKIYKTRHNDLWTPSQEKLVQHNVVHKIVSPERIAKNLKGEFAETNTKKTLNKLFEKYPVLRALKENHPDIYKKTISKLRDKIDSGASSKEISRYARKLGRRLSKGYLPQTGDQALTNYVQALVGVLGDLNSKSPRACYNMIYPNKAKKQSSITSFSDKDSARLQKAYARVLSNIIPKDARAIDKDKAKQTLVTYPSLKGGACRKAGPGGDQPQFGTQSS